jgi:hypothetical protein
MRQLARTLRSTRGLWVPMPAVFLLLASSAVTVAQMPGQKAPGPTPAQIEQTSHGFRAISGREVLDVTVCTDSVIHVVATPEPSATTSPRPWMLDAQQACPGAPFTFAQDAKAASMKTAELEVNVSGPTNLSSSMAITPIVSRTDSLPQFLRRCMDWGSTRAACSTIAAPR